MLNVNQVSYSVNDKTILKNISFTVKEGDFFTIIGPNGSGKSTLLKIILGIIKDYSGKISIDDALKIGYVPQEKTFDKKFPATAIELVLTGITKKWNFKNSNKNIEIALQTLEITNAINIAKKQLSCLSGGELQKVFLARAIVQKPNLLLLDEPTTGLDATSEVNMQNYIKSLNLNLNLNLNISNQNNQNNQNNQKTTIIMVTHNTDVAKKYSNKILLLNKEIIYCGDTAAGLENDYLKKVFMY